MTKQMDWDTWIETYDPVKHDMPTDDGEIIEFDTMSQCMDGFEEHLPDVDPENIAMHIWTVTSADDWELCSTGFHFVDRMFYMICRNPWTEQDEASVYEEKLI